MYLKKLNPIAVQLKHGESIILKKKKISSSFKKKTFLNRQPRCLK